MTWILILFAHTSMLSHNDSNSITTAIFATQQQCLVAGKEAEKLAGFTTKVIKYACVPSGLNK